MKNRSLLSSISALLLIVLGKLIPCNWIVGSSHAIFSCSTMLAPVIAKQFGFAWIGMFLVSKSLFTISFWIYSLMHRTPLLFAACAYRQRHWFTSFVVPAACMVLFVGHDTGAVAWCYSLYWLIPMGLYFVTDGLFARALTASLVAHGVGSVLWLYTSNIAAPVWIALIPVVACERLLTTLGMIAADVAIMRIKKYVSNSSLLSSLGWA